MLICPMAKKTVTNNKPLSPQELAKYKPAEILPKIQEDFPLGLNNVFELAKTSGASVIGKPQENPQEIPNIKK